MNDFTGNYIENFNRTEKKDFFTGKILSCQQKNQIFYFKTETTTFSVAVYSAEILRFRYAHFNVFQDDFSYAIDETAQFKEVAVVFTEDAEAYVIKTPVLICRINKYDATKKILNHDGVVICEDEKGYHWQDEKANGGYIVINTHKIQGGEIFFGLGDKPCDLNLRGKRLQMWGSDTYGYDKDTDPVYKNIPFYMGLHHKVGYGIFFDNSFRTFFDFGKERKNVTSYWAQGGEMNYFFIHGPSLMKVTERYADLTGKPELPPMWSLGYQQSKWSYYPEKVVRDLALTFRAKKIPCDVIHLDIDYMDGFRCFTWDDKKFPDPKKMIADLREAGFKVVVIIDPGIKEDPDYWVYQEALENDYFCKTSDGLLYRGSVWPGICNFPDFTKPAVRSWWADLFDGLAKDGVAGVWNDMNEPAVFEDGTFPNHVRHDYDGHPCSHRKGHNVYGMQMVRGTYEGMKKQNPDLRPFAITRSAYAGTQRYASVWTGDNVASWSHLIIANTQCQRLSTSGISFVGSDVGGFIESPDGELYTRWIQLAVFHPFFRTHSSGDHGDKEPWIFPKKYEDIVKRFIEFRYEILPNLYTAFWQNVTKGTPVLRSLYMIAQDDPETYHRQAEFMMGDNFLVCPIDQSNADGRWVYLTKGSWYNFWNDQYYSLPGEVWVDATLDSIPIFIRAGAVIAMKPAMQYVGEFEFESLTLHAYYNQKSTESVLYEDAGEGYGYKTGDQAIKTYRIEGSDKMMNIEQEIEGDFNPAYQNYELVCHGLPFAVESCLVDNEKVDFLYDPEKATCTIKVDKNFSNVKMIGL